MAGATEIGVLDLSFKAEQTFAAKQYYAVELSADDQVDVCDGAGDTVIGVVQNNPAAGQAATVRVLGVTKWVSDGNAAAIVVGYYVGTDTAGKCVRKSTDKDKVAGIALGASTTDGAVIDVLLTPGVTLRVT
jgi:hypothetical protein